MYANFTAIQGRLPPINPETATALATQRNRKLENLGLVSYADCSFLSDDNLIQVPSK